MLNNINLLIVIPCFNETDRIDVNEIKTFLESKKRVSILFVNDGSTDTTLSLLHNIQKNNNDNVDVLDLTKNVGKAEAVRQGFLYATENYEFDKIAYLDADLATPLEECYRISKKVKDNILFCFGSRILKIDTTIKRKFYRFLIGRIIATVISFILKAPVYDTQCGCKIFSKKNILELFVKPFISKWLFDVEIFYRFILLHGRENFQTKIREIPLKKWVNIGESKVSIFYFFRLWIDLWKIKTTYRKKE